MAEHGRRPPRPPVLLPASPVLRSPARVPAVAAAVAAAAAAAGLSRTASGGGEGGTPPLTPTHRRKQIKGQHPVGQEHEMSPLVKQLPAAAAALAVTRPGSRGGMPAAVLFGAFLLVMMITGLASTDMRLRVSNTAVLTVPPPRLSAASFAQQQQERERHQAATPAEPVDGDGGSSGGFAAMFSTVAAAVAEQLIGGGGGDSSEQQQEQQHVAAAEAAADGVDALLPATPTWQLRCAVLNNLVFHIDVMAGWTYAFQTAGCDVTVYQNEHSLGIEEIMSGWLTGRFRKPEHFPGEAGDYHIVILPTFRDQHAEMVQYLLQLPRLKLQRYFLTQHNPDWLLNHPNVDILQQQVLLPLLEAAQADHAAEAGREGEQQPQGTDEAAGAAVDAAAAAAGPDSSVQPGGAQLLRLQLATLAPCVSNYTLQFLRQMAFNLTQGATYTARFGSFKVRGTVLQAVAENGTSSKDNSGEIRQWVDRVINVEVPWFSPLVPWQAGVLPDAAAGVEAAALPTAATPEGGGDTEEREAEGQDEVEVAAVDGGGTRRMLRDNGEDGGTAAGDDDDPESDADASGRRQEGRQQDARGKKPEAAEELPPPPAAPPGGDALSLLEALNAMGSSSARHVCIQGKLENSRRNYTAAFEAVSQPAVLNQLRSQGERLLLLGHRSKSENVTVPDAIQDVVEVLESLPYQLYFDTLSRCRAILLAFATDEYYTKKSSSTIATAINVGVPLVAEQRTLSAYTFLNPDACFVYDDRIAADGSSLSGNRGGDSSSEEQQQQEEEAEEGSGGDQQRDRRRLLKAGGARKPRASRGKKQPDETTVGEEGGEQQQLLPQPAAGSYSAAILAALQSEGRAAVVQAVKQLKAEVMSHNVMVAAAFMAETEQQYSAAQQVADAAQWQLRVQDRWQLEGQQEVVWNGQREEGREEEPGQAQQQQAAEASLR